MEMRVSWPLSGDSEGVASRFEPVQGLVLGDSVGVATDAMLSTNSNSDSTESPDRSVHVELCPEGGRATRWYLCRQHPQAFVFQADSGQVDSVANSCPVCGSLCSMFTGCTCDYASHPLDRASRPGRQIRRRVVTEE